MVNWLVASAISFSHAIEVAAPCAIDEQILSSLNDVRAVCAYALNFEVSTSVRAGIDPFVRLNASCPSFDEIVSSHAFAPSGFFAPSGRVNESARNPKIFSLPGSSKWTKSAPSFLPACSNAATAQSPMTL